MTSGCLNAPANEGTLLQEKALRNFRTELKFESSTVLKSQALYYNKYLRDKLSDNVASITWPYEKVKEGGSSRGQSSKFYTS